VSDSSQDAAVGARPQPDVEVVPSGPNRFGVRGALTFRTARRAVDAGIRAFGASTASTIEVDLSGVRASDSAGLAVLIEWIAWARRSSRQLALRNLPEAIRAIARISDVERLVSGG